MESRYRKQIGGQGEEIVQALYESHGYICKAKNFTIRGGEIDLVMEHPHVLVFVEVKVVNYVENLHDYITQHKLVALRRSIDTYLYRFPTKKDTRVDVVFVKDGLVIERYKEIEL